MLKGRGEGDNIDLVAEALHRCDYLQPLMETDRLSAIFKGIVRASVRKVQEHWTPRHAVHIWDRLELSREQMEALRHLLSFIYNPQTDKYEPIKAWVNPKDPTDFVLSARLAARAARETMYQEIAQQMNIVVGANGRCERDFVECTSLLYSKYAKDLRRNYTQERPAGAARSLS